MDNLSSRTRKALVKQFGGKAGGCCGIGSRFSTKKSFFLLQQKKHECEKEHRGTHLRDQFAAATTSNDYVERQLRLGLYFLPQ